MGNTMILLDEEDVLRVVYEEDAGIQIHEWFDYNPEGRDGIMRQLLDRIYQLLMDYPVQKLLVKASNARGAFSPEIQNFIRDVQFPRLIERTAIRYVATMKPRDEFATISTELWKGQLKAHTPLVMHDVHDESEARAWFVTVEEQSRMMS